jgi:hypothetical protein
MRIYHRPFLSAPLWVIVLLLLSGLATGLALAASGQRDAQPPGAWTLTGSFNSPRADHTATRLLDGRVLIAGGNTLVSAEVYQPGVGTWSFTGSMSNARYRHTATLLGSGQVLVAGGCQGSFCIGMTSAERYNPASGAWSNTGSMGTGREGHTATLLPNGKVLVVGGCNSLPCGYGASAELYDSASGTWTATGSLATARTNHAATLLQNGKVLVVGGQGASGTLASTELYDPATGTWTTTGSLTSARQLHTATLLNNGKVLAAGGCCSFLASSELYDPTADTWSATGSLSTARSTHTATLLDDGRVLVAGGRGSSPSYHTSAELYDPTMGTWSTTGNLNDPRSNHTATLLTNGQVLAAGGFNGFNVASAELYEPLPLPTATPTSTSTPSNTPTITATPTNTATPTVTPTPTLTAPNMVSYQGRVTISGVPHNGTGYFKFAIVNPTGTTSYWSNDGTSTNGSEPGAFVSLSVSSGLFNVLLGDTLLPGMTQPLTAAVFSTNDRSLRVWFASAPGGPFTQLAPDRPISSAPYALNAATLGGQDASAFASVGHNHFGQAWIGNGGAGLTLNNSGGFGLSASGTITGVYGFASATSGESFGVYGQSDTIGFGPGIGVYGSATGNGGRYGVFGTSPSVGVGGYATGGTGVEAGGDTGVFAVSNSSTGYGVYSLGGRYGLYTVADNFGTTFGVYANTDSSLGYGVYAEGGAYGVYGAATSAGTTYGVYGESNSGYGVYGKTHSTDLYASGMYGIATATTGVTYGVYGETNSTYSSSGFGNPSGVYGVADTTIGVTYGVFGRTRSTQQGASGVYGYASATGTGSTYGVYGETNASSGRGVYGYASYSAAGSMTYGVYGASANIGVYGETSNTVGAWGLYTPDDLYVGGSCVGCTLAFGARNGDSVALEQGDLVAVVGVEASVTPGGRPVMVVRRAQAGDRAASVVGVVYHAGQPEVSGSDPEGQTQEQIWKHRAGPAAPGDLLTFIAYGPTYVKVSGAVATGDLLIAGSEAGTARAAPVLHVNGLAVQPKGVLGKVLGPADSATGLAPVLVTLD